MRGEDLLAAAEPVDEWGMETAIHLSPSAVVPVRDVPGENGSRSWEPGSGTARTGERGETVSGVARESDQEERPYAPYRADAGSPAPAAKESSTAVTEPPRQSAEELVKRMTTTLERMNKALTPEILDDCRQLPEKVRKRFLKAVGDLGSRAGQLM